MRTQLIMPDGRTLEVWSGWPENLPPGSTWIGETPDNLPIYRTPDGRHMVCMYTAAGLKCAAFEIKVINPGNGPGGVFPYLVLEPSRRSGEGGSAENPPSDDTFPTPIVWEVTSEGVFDSENDMASLSLPVTACSSWPDESHFDVSVAEVGGVRTVSGSTSHVGAYLAEAGVRRMYIPAEGMTPELLLEFRVDELTPIISSDGSIAGYLDFDIMVTRLAADWSLVPASYKPVRPLGRVR